MPAPRTKQYLQQQFTPPLASQETKQPKSNMSDDCLPSQGNEDSPNKHDRQDKPVDLFNKSPGYPIADTAELNP